MGPLTSFGCIYCGEVKEKGNLEHVIPASLSTKRRDVFLRTRNVCEECNSGLGETVDIDFARSFLISNEVTLSNRNFVNPESGSALPLFFMGRPSNLELPSGLVADRLLGPAGEKILHVYEFSKKFEHLQGGNPVRKAKMKPHRVYFSLRTQHPVWVATAFKSIKSRFPFAEVFLATTGLFEIMLQNAALAELYRERPRRGRIWRFEEAPENERDEISKYLFEQKTSQGMFSVNVFNDVKFFSKSCSGSKRCFVPIRSGQ